MKNDSNGGTAFPAEETQEILQCIAEATIGVPVKAGATFARLSNDDDWGSKLSQAISNELDIALRPEEVGAADSLLQLSRLVEGRLGKDPMGRSITDIYTTVGKLVREELARDVNYYWYAFWVGDIFTEFDSLDDVEVVIRMEDAFGFAISDRDAQSMQTVGQTVRYLWRRSCEQGFTLKPQPPIVCQRAFVFYEMRRLIVIRAGVPSTAVRLNTRLGDLLPTSYMQFWEDVRRIFRPDLPQRSALEFGSGAEKNITIRELVNLVSIEW
jgi:acyl carrier protein